MRLFWLIIFLGFPALAADSLPRGKTRPELDKGELFIQNLILQERFNESEKLRQAKFHLLNGRTQEARQTLTELMHAPRSALYPVALRYLATVEFLEGRWNEAYDTLNTKELRSDPHYQKVCHLGVALRVSLKHLESLEGEARRCKATNTEASWAWMDALVTMAMRSGAGTARELVEKSFFINLPNEDLKRVLKLALFLNQEQWVAKEIETFDATVVEDEELRALIAHLQFRNGRFSRAWRHMEGLTGPNVENMRGNLWLLRGNKELAYAQFKLALQQKSNSHNAAERALPLAWSLHQWSDGRKIAERFDSSAGNQAQRLTVAAAFALEQEDWQGARAKLRQALRTPGGDESLEVEQLSTYVALRLGDQRDVATHGGKACEKGDIVACWLMIAQNNWQGLTPYLNREPEESGQRPVAWVEISALPADQKFTETVTIDQRDIDELDDALIKLVK